MPSSILTSSNAQEHGDLLALIALELDDLAHLLVIDNSAVARKFLLECLEKLLGVIFWSDKTHPWAGPGASSASYGHYAAGCECARSCSLE